ncbi:MAG: hypothetical protein AAGB22_03320, partial [Bacteroidota bacterium]
MLNLRPVIDQLKDDEFNQIADRLHQAKADKFLLLLNAIRHEALEDEQIREQLGVNQNAFYVLKSRLFEKIQDFLIDSMAEPRSALLKKSSLIPTIAFEMPKDKAIAMLTKMEKEYKRFDLPYELTSIYQALKKLHQYSDKHYHYVQQYNKHMAYMVPLDKAEDLMSD